RPRRRLLHAPALRQQAPHRALRGPADDRDPHHPRHHGAVRLVPPPPPHLAPSRRARAFSVELGGDALAPWRTCGPRPRGPRPACGPDGFDWMAWHPDPTVVVGLAALGGLYLAELRRGRARGKTAEPAQILSFFAGLILLLGCLTGPLHDLSDYYLFSAHMIQHLLLAFAMPPLLLYGTPGWMIEPLLR